MPVVHVDVGRPSLHAVVVLLERLWIFVGLIELGSQASSEYPGRMHLFVNYESCCCVALAFSDLHELGTVDAKSSLRNDIFNSEEKSVIEGGSAGESKVIGITRISNVFLGREIVEFLVAR